MKNQNTAYKEKKKLKFVQFIRQIYELSGAKDIKALAQLAHPGGGLKLEKEGQQKW